MLTLTHRILLYCPFLDIKKLLSLFRNVQQNWREIEQNLIKEQSDRTRCLFFSKLIQTYAEVLLEKTNLATQYHLIIDWGYCL